MSYAESFSRNWGLVSVQEQSKLRSSCLAIAGLGGVGGAYAITLARLGVGRFHLADFDSFELANFNRQQGAMHSTLGQPKVEVIKKMILDINPEAEVTLFQDGVTESNVMSFLRGVDTVADAIDFYALEARRLLFAKAREAAIPVVTSGPIAMTTTLQVFTPTSMSFEDYFAFDLCKTDQERLAGFMAGTAPGFLNRGQIYFGRYYIKNILFYGAMTAAVLVGVVAYQYAAELSAWHLLAIPLSIYLGCLSAVFIHNASHGNFRPMWLNSVAGEVSALQQLSAGFPVFRFIHNTHHANPDDPVMDPHPPKGYSFFAYIDAARNMIGKNLAFIFFKRWGDTPQNRRLWGVQSLLLIIARFAKTLFLFCLLGPHFFALLFLPSYLANVFIFASFNYYSHRERSDGEVEILNLNDQWIYKFANATLFGVMYHKNHHLKPKLFNPRPKDTHSERAQKKVSLSA